MGIPLSTPTPTALDPIEKRQAERVRKTAADFFKSDDLLWQGSSLATSHRRCASTFHLDVLLINLFQVLVSPSKSSSRVKGTRHPVVSEHGDFDTAKKVALVIY